MKKYKNYLKLVTRTKENANISRGERYLKLYGNINIDSDYSIDNSKVERIFNPLEEPDLFMKFMSDGNRFYIEQIINVSQKTDPSDSKAWDIKIDTEFITYVYEIEDMQMFMDSFAEEEYMFSFSHSYDYIHRRLVSNDTDIIISAAMIEIVKLIEMGSPIVGNIMEDGSIIVETNELQKKEDRKEIISTLNKYLDEIMLNEKSYNQIDIKHIMIACNELLNPFGEEISKALDEYNEREQKQWELKKGLEIISN